MTQKSGDLSGDPVKDLDVICMGRASVDLYGDQVGGRLEDMASFSKYVGGCPANISIATARLGLKSAMVTRVGDDHMGRFIRETMKAEGVNVTHVHTDPDRLTALVILGIRDRETFPLIFYRENCADMALSTDDIDEHFIRSARALVVSGTHLSARAPRDMSRTVMGLARRNGVKVVLDIDYRPVLWGLTGKALGEERFVEDDTVSEILQGVAGSCDVIVGTEEEFHIAGGITDTTKALANLRTITNAVLVVKLGPDGAAAFDASIPERITDDHIVPGFPVDVYNVLGAGDAFMGGLLRGYLSGRTWAESCRMANAAGAIVVSRHGCAPATPSLEELTRFMETGSPHFRLREDKTFEHLHWATTRHQDYPEVLAFAFDHRSQLELMAGENGCDADAIGRFKLLCWQAVERAADDFPGNGLGILCDGRLGGDALNRATAYGPPPPEGRNIWIGRPIERPGIRPLTFEGTPSLGVTLREWPVNHCVKCLVFYHPDDSADLRERQEEALLRLVDASRNTGHELLIEVITPEKMPRDETTIPAIIDHFYQIGIYPDWWKLPPPVNDAEWHALADVIRRYDIHCRGIVLLGFDAPIEGVREAIETAAQHTICRGFAVGRTIFADAARGWFEGTINDEEAIGDMANRYGDLIKSWNRSRVMARNPDERNA